MAKNVANKIATGTTVAEKKIVEIYGLDGKLKRLKRNNFAKGKSGALAYVDYRILWLQGAKEKLEHAPSVEVKFVMSIIKRGSKLGLNITQILIALNDVALKSKMV